MYIYLDRYTVHIPVTVLYYIVGSTVLYCTVPKEIYLVCLLDSIRVTSINSTREIALGQSSLELLSLWLSALKERTSVLNRRRKD